MTAKGSLSKSLLENEGSQEGEEGPVLELPQENKSHCANIRELFKLAIPVFVARLTWVAMKTTDTALLGHSGTKALSASAVSDLWTSSTGILIQGGMLGTFCAQAIGAGNKMMAGIWLQNSCFILALLALPVMACWACTGLVISNLRAVFGDVSDLADMAEYYALVLMLCIPARIVFNQLSQYLQAQKIMHPFVTMAALSMILNLIFGLITVLGIPIPGWNGWGFRACPVVTTSVEWWQMSFFLLYYCAYKGVHKDCWPGWSWSHVTKARLAAYSRLYFPAALSIASDFWRVAVIGAFAASMSSEDLAVFNSSYRILWITLTFVGSIAAATSIHMGQALGAGDGPTAKYWAFLGAALALALLAVLGFIVFTIPRVLGSIFSNDPAVLDLYEEIRLPLALVMVTMNAAVVLERIPSVMGRTSLVLGLGLVGSWVGQVPGVALCLYKWRNDIVGLYYGVAAGYLLLDILLLYVMFTSDYQNYADEAQLRSEVKTVPVEDPDKGNDNDDTP